MRGGIKVFYGSETLCMTFYGLGDIIEDGFADMCAANSGVDGGPSS